jgi:competence protein ComEC
LWVRWRQQYETRHGPVLLDSDVTTRVTGVVEAREFDAEGRVRYLLRLTATSDPEIRRPPPRVRLVARAAHTPAPVGATDRRPCAALIALRTGVAWRL